MRYLIVLLAVLLALGLAACDDTSTTAPKIADPYANGAIFTIEKINSDTLYGGREYMHVTYIYNQTMELVAGQLRYSGGYVDTTVYIYGRSAGTYILTKPGVKESFGINSQCNLEKRVKFTTPHNGYSDTIIFEHSDSIVTWVGGAIAKGNAYNFVGNASITTVCK